MSDEDKLKALLVRAKRRIDARPDVWRTRRMPRWMVNAALAFAAAGRAVANVL